MKLRSLKSTLGILLVSLFAIGPALVSAQQVPPSNGQSEQTDSVPWPTLDLVRAYLAQVEAPNSLESPRKDELIGQYRAAIADLEAAAQAQTQTKAFDDDRIAAPQRLADIRQEMTTMAAAPADADLSGDLNELETRLSNIRQEFDSARTERDTLTSEASRRTERLSALPSLIAARRDEIRNLGASANTAPQGDALTTEFAAQVVAAAKRKRLEAELRLLEAEQSSYTARAENLTARRERADRLTTRLSRQVDALQQEVTRVRAAQAEAQAQESRSQAEELPKALSDAATENALLAEKLAAVQRQIGDVSQRRTEAQTRLGALRTRLETFEAPNGDIELDRWFGIRLRNELARLPNAREMRLAARRLQTEIGSIRREQFELNDTLLNVSGNVDARIEELLEASPRRNERIEAAADSIARQQLNALRSLDAAYNELLSVTLELAAALEQTSNEVEQFENFIERRILWVRSDDALTVQSFSIAYEGVLDVANPNNWTALPSAALNQLRSQTLRHVGALLLALGLLLVAPRLRNKARNLQISKSAPVRQRMVRTLLALGALIAASLAMPAVLVVLAQFCFAIDVDWVFATPFGAALLALAILLFAVQLVVGLCRAGGVGEHDLRWPSDARKRTMRVLRAWTPFAVVAAAGRYFFVYAQTSPGASEAARLFIMAWLLMLPWIAWRLIRRDTPIMRAFWGTDRSTWAFRIWPLISFAAIVGPFALAAAAALGYTYTAMQLSQRISASILAIIALILARAILRRWLILQRRQLAVEQLRAAQAKATSGAEAVSDIPPIQIASDSIDLAVIGEQTARLVRVGTILVLVAGLLVIWANLLPALGILQDIRIEALKLTLGDVLAAIIAGALTFIFARNAPGLLEISVLRRLPLDAGGRYAVSSLSRYVIVLAGVIAAGAALGLKWSSVQWLAAAATVGLGFGLQEIFANFVSGLIILFERPLRVGDTVTVGSLTGTVTKIRIRATTILDWDRKEIIIPNKDFITTQLVNWTLTDSILRVILNVGVAYGSDTELVEKLLLKIAKENSIILNEPKPQVLFREFGDSALTFELRVFLPSIDNFVTIRHNVNRAIDREFKAHGIEIAFPQRDLHIRSIPAALAQSIAAQTRPHVASESSEQ